MNLEGCLACDVLAGRVDVPGGTIDETEHSVTLHVEAAWRPDYVGTTQKRFFRFENGRLLFGPAANSMTVGDEKLTRRLTLERAPD